MDPNNLAPNLDMQQLQYLASLVGHLGMMQQLGHPQPAMSQPGANQQFYHQFSQPQPSYSVPAVNHQIQQQGGQSEVRVSNPFFTQGMNHSMEGHGASSEWAGLGASSEPSSMQSPRANMGSPSIDIEETSPPKQTGGKRTQMRAGRAPRKQVQAAQPKRVKEANFQPFEDETLVKSWLEISCDPMTNTGQTQECFWLKVTNLYNSRRGMYPKRTDRSLQSRYDGIKRHVAKFSLYYHDVVRENPSGMSDADKTSLACSRYATCEKGPFKYMHCWDILKDNPKFQDTKHGRNFNQDDGLAFEPQEADPLRHEPSVDQPCSTPTSTGSKRPMGRDACKRANKKSTASTPSASEFATSMQDLWISKLEDTEVNRKSLHEEYLAWMKEQKEEERRRELEQQEEARRMELEEREEARRDRKIMRQLEKKKFKLEERKVAIKESLSEAEKKRIEMMHSQE